MAKKKKIETEQVKEQAKEPAESPFGISVALEKINTFGGDKIKVTVFLYQDGKLISSDSDFVTL